MDLQQEFKLIRGLSDSRNFTITEDVFEYDKTFERIKETEHRWSEDWAYDGKFLGRTDKYLRPMGIEFSLLNSIYLKNFKIQQGG